ncbi:MAG: DUF350 domain-containing protein [Bacteroidetes bacterium]|nr:MAG: DUF350 domain-containing protein [Bacteroidota bacterium]
MEEYMTDIKVGLGYAVGAIALIWFAKYMLTSFRKNLNIRQELTEHDNLAFALAIVGYFVAVIIVIASAIVGPSHGWTQDMLALFFYGSIAILLLNLSAMLNDKIILRNFSIRDEIFRDQNAGMGAIEAGNYIASALIVFGAVSGSGVDFFPELSSGYWLSGLITAVVFWMVGQILLFGFTHFYNLIVPFNIHDEIEKDNAAVGVSYAGVLIAVGLLIGSGISGDFVSWADHFTWLGIEVGIGLIALPLIRWITDVILLPGAKITDELVNQEKPNVGVGIIEAFAYVGGAAITLLVV